MLVEFNLEEKAFTAQEDSVMQVFLPEKSFTESAKVLDQKRLVKQLLEGRQILTVLAGSE